MTETPLQLALASDGNMIDAAMVVIGSARAHATAPLCIHFLGHEIAAADRRRLEAFCHGQGCDFVFHEVTEAAFGGATQANANIPLVALARLHLPSMLEGRVLYLDCDMLVQGDVAELFRQMPEGALMGVVRDFYVLDQIARGVPKPARLAWHRKLLGRQDVSGYFNSGLLLMDCDEIRRDAALMARMTDVAASEGMRFMDQDYLNLVFDGRVHYLPLAWNSIWKRDRRRARSLRKLHWLPEAEKCPAKTRLIHYTGPYKPWKAQSRIKAALRGRLSALRDWDSAAARYQG